MIRYIVEDYVDFCKYMGFDANRYETLKLFKNFCKKVRKLLDEVYNSYPY